jgi:hypothetical protein
LKDALYSNGYPEGLVGDAVKKALMPINVPDTDTPGSSDTNTSRRSHESEDWEAITKFITPYNSKNPNFSKILNNHINILTSHPRGAFDDLNIKVIHKRPKNLSDDLVHSSLLAPSHTSSVGVPCLDQRCLACPSMILTQKISSNTLSLILKTHSHVTQKIVFIYYNVLHAVYNILDKQKPLFL